MVNYKKKRNIPKLDSRFYDNLGSIIYKLIIDRPFYGLMLNSINKVFIDNKYAHDFHIPLMGIGATGINYSIFINKNRWLLLSDIQKEFFLCHEIDHLVLGHLKMRDDYTSDDLFNRAADVFINEVLLNDSKFPRDKIFNDYILDGNDENTKKVQEIVSQLALKRDLGQIDEYTFRNEFDKCSFPLVTSSTYGIDRQSILDNIQSNGTDAIYNFLDTIIDVNELGGSSFGDSDTDNSDSSGIHDDDQNDDSDHGNDSSDNEDEQDNEYNEGDQDQDQDYSDDEEDQEEEVQEYDDEDYNEDYNEDEDEQEDYDEENEDYDYNQEDSDEEESDEDDEEEQLSDSIGQEEKEEEVEEEYQDYVDYCDNNDIPHPTDHPEWQDLDDLDDDTSELMDSQFKHQLSEVVEEVSRSKGNIPGHLRKVIDNLLKVPKPIYDYKKLTRKWIKGFSKKVIVKRTRMRPNLYIPEFLRNRLKYNKHLVFIKDTSMSVDNDTYLDFCAEGLNIKRTTNCEVTVIECDAHIDREKGIYTLESLDQVKRRLAEGEVVGGGGTDVTPAFKYIQEDLDQYTAVIYFTDGWVQCPPKEFIPNIPILLLLSGDAANDEQLNYWGWEDYKRIRIPKDYRVKTNY